MPCTPNQVVVVRDFFGVFFFGSHTVSPTLSFHGLQYMLFLSLLLSLDSANESLNSANESALSIAMLDAASIAARMQLLSSLLAGVYSPFGNVLSRL